jgi:hypothetical protein
MPGDEGDDTSSGPTGEGPRTPFVPGQLDVLSLVWGMAPAAGDHLRNRSVALNRELFHELREATLRTDRAALEPVSAVVACNVRGAQDAVGHIGTFIIEHSESN